MGFSISRFWPFHIERQRFFRAVQPDEMAREPMPGGVVASGDVTIHRSLDLDDARSQIGGLASWRVANGTATACSNATTVTPASGNDDPGTGSGR